MLSFLSLSGTAGNRHSRGQELNRQGKGSSLLQEPCSVALPWATAGSMVGSGLAGQLPPCPLGLPLGRETHPVCWLGAWADSGIGSVSGRARQKGHLPARQPRSYSCWSSLLGISSSSYSTWIWLVHEASPVIFPILYRITESFRLEWTLKIIGSNC